LNGVPVFEALHTSVNEYSEIRSMTLTPSKAHSQFMPALAAIADSLENREHDPIELVFTDNPRLDKPELETVLPSLLKDVVPVPNPNSFPTFCLPPSAHIYTLSSTFQVNTRLEAVMAAISSDKDCYMAVDMEWPVNTTNGIHGHVALISIAHKEDIFLIPVSHKIFVVYCSLLIKASRPVHISHAMMGIFIFPIFCWPGSAPHLSTKLALESKAI
jgi:hypothetical protein